jgi:hypothetical protein
MDSSVHSIIAAQYIRERIDEATAARAAREAGRRKPRAWNRRKAGTPPVHGTAAPGRLRVTRP